MAIAQHTPSLHLAPWRAGFALAGLLLACPSLQAVEFASEDGSITGALDTTVSYGAMWRVEEQDDKRYKGSSSPDRDDVNLNDGNRAFDKGLVSQVFRVSADLEVDWEEQYGVFMRGTAFYDTVLMDTHNNWSDANAGANAAGFPDQTGTYPFGDDWSKDVRDGQGHDAKIQDAYVYGSWDIGDMPLDVRFGRQVINWGEGLFYRDGINTINALDGASYALPGSEVKDLLIPQNALAFSLGITDNLSMSAYYQFEWEESVTPGRGTYFSTNDLFTDGGTKGYNEAPDTLKQLRAGWAATPSGVGSQTLSQLLGDLYAVTGVNVHGDYLVVADTSAKQAADDDGQWGFSFKYYSEELNDTEFGFYFVNYNSHVPYIDATIAQGAAAKALAAVTGAGNTSLATALDNYYTGVATAQLAQLGVTSPTAQQLAAAKQEVIGGVAGAHIMSNSISARRVFPEDIQMYGLSFNTAFGRTSVAGELAYRPNAPIWIDHPDDLIAGISSNLAGIDDGVDDSTDGILEGANCFKGLSVVNPDKQYCISSGPYKNYEKVKLWTGSLVFVHNFGPQLSFDGLYGILEPAFEYIQDLDNYTKYLSSGSGPHGPAFEGEYHPSSDRLDKFSWGYTAVLSAEMNDVFAGVNLNPVISFKHDVNGNSRRTGNFLAGRKAVTVGLKGVYMHVFEAGLAYTSFFGSERTNAVSDRDNVAFNMKYSF